MPLGLRFAVGLLAACGLVACTGAPQAPPSLTPDELRAALVDWDARVGDPERTPADVRAGALAALDAVLADQPEALAALERRARWRAEWGPQRGALEDVERIEALYGPTAGTAAVRGRAHHALGRRPEALGAYRDALARDPRHVGALAQLGVLLVEAGRLAEAATYFRRVLAIEPDHPSAGSYLELARAQGDAAGAGAGAGGERDPWAAKRFGLAMIEAGRDEAGLELLLEALEALPDDVDVLGAAGRVLARLGRPRQAAVMLAAATAARPDDPELARLLGFELARLAEENPRRARAAAETLARAAELAPGDATVHRLAAEARERSGDLAGALRELDRALACDPSDAAAYVARGALLARHLGPNAAASALEAGLAAAPDDALLVANLALQEAERGDARACRALRARLAASGDPRAAELLARLDDEDAVREAVRP